MAQSSTRYLPHVDGLRAIAIALVVVYHAWPERLPGGFVGVDVFFVISGFLITRLILQEIESGQFSLFDFYVRRIRRLMPAAVVVCIVVSAAAAVIMPPHDLRQFGRSLTAVSLLVSNFHFANNTGYFAPSIDTMPLVHTWSLAVEEQFYLIWPLALLCLASMARLNWALAVCALVTAASLVASLLPAAEAGSWFFMPWARFWELGVGAGLALLVRRELPSCSARKVTGALAAACVLIGLAMIAFSAISPIGNPIVPGPVLLLSVFGTALVIAGGIFFAGVPTLLLCCRPLVFVGLISYSLYLWHWPLISLARYQTQRSLYDGELAIIVCLSLIVAAASWRWVEQPFRTANGEDINWSPAAAKLNVLMSAIAVTVLLAGVGGAMNGGKGWSWRYSTKERTVLRQMSSGSPWRKSCDGLNRAFKNDAFCNVGRSKPPAESYDGVLLGDSNADHFLPGLASFAKSAQLSLRQVTQSQCGPVLGFKNLAWTGRLSERCLNYQRAIMRFLDRNPRVRLAILAASWQAYRFEAKTGVPNYQPVHSILPRRYFEAATRWGYREDDIRHYLFATIAYLRETLYPDTSSGPGSPH